MQNWDYEEGEMNPVSDSLEIPASITDYMSINTYLSSLED